MLPFVPRLPHSLLEWIPAILLTFIAVSGAATCLALQGDSVFNPLKFESIKVVENRISVGQQITLIDGICNSSKKTIGVMVTLGIRRHETEILTTESFTIVDNRVVPIEPGCQYNDPIMGPLPPNITPGTWEVFVDLTARGSKVNDIQRISLVSNAFEVVP